MFLRSVVRHLNSGLFHARKVCSSSFSIPKTMKAVGLYEYLPIDDPRSLQDVKTNVLEVNSSEVLVAVKAVGINPLDTKIRAPVLGKVNPSGLKILGWDGSGVVVDKARDVQNTKIGDEVFFIGDVRENGANAEYIKINTNLIATKPKNLTFEEAAAMPLVSVTAWEALFDRLQISEHDRGKCILIINSAGGVGSVAIQLAKHIGLKVIGTASRPDTKAFSKNFGADLVLDHNIDLATQLESTGIEGVDYILVNYDPFAYWESMMKIIKPLGKICTIVDSNNPVNVSLMKEKSVTLVAEMMFTRLKFNIPEKSHYRNILDNITRLIENGKLKTILSQVVSPINAKNLREAHKIIESKQMRGKLVVSGF